MKIQKKILYSINTLLLSFVFVFTISSVYFLNDKIKDNLILDNKKFITQTEFNINNKYQNRLENLDFLMNSDKVFKFISTTGHSQLSKYQNDLISHLNSIKNEKHSFKEYFILNKDRQPIFEYTDNIFYDINEDLNNIEQILLKTELSGQKEFLAIQNFSFGKRIAYINQNEFGFLITTEDFNFLEYLKDSILNEESAILLLEKNKIIDKNISNFNITDIDNIEQLISIINYDTEEIFQTVSLGFFKPSYYVFKKTNKYNMHMIKIIRKDFLNKEFLFYLSILMFFIITLISIIWYSIFKSIKKFVVDKIHILKVASLNISKGKYENQVKIKEKNELNDEIIDLANSFNEMSKNIFESTNKIQRIAYFDHLTQLPNKKSFDKHIFEYSKLTDFGEKQIACFLIDLDDFKSVNDIYGHEKGDLFLIEIGKKLQLICEHLDKKFNLNGIYDIYRISGDDFVINIVSNHILNNIDIVSQEIVKNICDKIEVNGDSITPFASIGISCYPFHTPLLEKLFNYADIAMYNAKEKGKNQYSIINEAILMARKEKDMLDKEIKEALENNDFILHFQPKYNINKDYFNHFEALIRWPHKEKGWISPSKFIPHAEKTSLILNIGDWVINSVCKHVKILEDLGYEDFKISFNVSSQQMKSKEFFNKLKKQIDFYNINSKHLEMEITEYTSVEDIENTLVQLKLVRDIGVSVSLDDFGKDYSSLSYLQNLPLDVLKIDKTFVSSSINKDPEKAIKGRAIIKTIITLAQGLGLKTVAEGVEVEEEYNLLKSLGCDFVQGWYFYKALEFKEIVKLLENKKPRKRVYSK